jgi:RNA polymerase sigma factor (sigma-70 family)
MLNRQDQRRQIEKELVQYVPALRKIARRFHTSACDVDDLVQETIMKALANVDKFELGSRLKSWLFTIMRNTFCTKFGLSKREYVGLEDDCAQKSSVPATQEWSIRGQELEIAIGDLPDHYRNAIDLIFVQGISYEAAAKASKCPVGTMKSRVNRARAILTGQLR